MIFGRAMDFKFPSPESFTNTSKGLSISISFLFRLFHWRIRTTHSARLLFFLKYTRNPLSFLQNPNHSHR